MDLLGKQFPAFDFSILAVVLALPLLGAIVNGVFGKRLGREGVRLMALSAIGGSFLASLLTFLFVLQWGHVEWTAWEWLSFVGRTGKTIPIDVKFSADAMTATMMLVVTGIGWLIHLYSTEYMKEDPGYHRFFSYLNLFCFSMLVLILGDNLPILFVGWEGVGLCSYLLIGFWFDQEKNAAAGKKAFITNRIGDFGLLLAMAMLVYFTSALDWKGVESSAGNLLATVKVWPIGNLPTEAQWAQQHAAGSPWPQWLVFLFLPEGETRVYAATLVGLALFLGCAGKSAQIPLYVWLPDAMAGPTPVSALIHAATMVTAGVYLVARTSFIFVMSPAAMATVAIAGAITAVFAATIGLFQHDLKKVLAYSTVSQLGYMFIGVGVGAFSAGFFHVFTHAFFKACLFLGAGSVIHAMHARIHDTDASQDMRNMGKMRKFMPITHATFALSTASIVGFPFLAGFWSKDEILWKAFSVKVNGPTMGGQPPADMWQWPEWLGTLLYVAGVLGAVLTAFYMGRAYLMTFWGDKFRGWKIVRGWQPAHGHDAHGHDDHGDDGHHVGEKLEGPRPHESAPAITIPLVVLGAGAVCAGWIGMEPIAHSLHVHVAPLFELLGPTFAHASQEITVREGVEHLMWPMMLPGVGAFLLGTGGAYYVYKVHAGRPEQSFKESMPGLYNLIYDKWRIDELYDATVLGMVDALADIFTMADKWIVDGIIARLSAAVVGGVGSVLRMFQTGRVQVYAAAMTIGLFGTGWFFMRPHADIRVHAEELETKGVYELEAAPGFGYTYRWKADGLKEQPEFRNMPKVWLPIAPGEQKEVTVEVRNAIGSVATESFVVTREAVTAPQAQNGPQGGPGAAAVLPAGGAR